MNNENPRVVRTSHIGNLISIIKERENKKDGIGIKNYIKLGENEIIDYWYKHAKNQEI